MIYNNVELFNVEEIRETDDGLKMYRFPRSVIAKMGAKDSALTTSGCEIRFVGEAYITVGAASAHVDGYGRVEVYRGDIWQGMYTFPAGSKCLIKLQYNTAADSAIDDFSKVWRVVFGNDFEGVIYDMESFGEVRPPKKGEIPEKTIVAYGSSITNGACSVSYSNAHIFKLAQKLGVNIENKGVGGGCFCEQEVLDYLAAKKCDLLYLELGINMLGWLEAEKYYEKAAYIFARIDKRIPTVLVSPYRHFRSVSKIEAERQKVENYSKTAKQLYEDFKRDNLYFIDGLEIVDDLNMLTCDMIHPSIFGHHVMSEKLYKKLIAIV